jgi:hypothetical protein
MESLFRALLLQQRSTESSCAGDSQFIVERNSKVSSVSIFNHSCWLVWRLQHAMRACYQVNVLA